jgi:hypothetical protein
MINPKKEMVLIGEISRENLMDENMGLFPSTFSIALLLSFILFIYSIIMNGITPDAIFYGIITLILAFCGFISWIWFKPKWNKYCELKHTHRDELKTKILDNLKDLKFKYQYFEYTIQNFQKIDNRLYSDIRQHFESYLNIKEYLDGIIDSINNLNGSLKDNKEFTLYNIEKELGKSYKKDISEAISSIIEYGIGEEIGWLGKRRIEIKKDGVYIDLSENWKVYTHIAKKEFDWKQISQYISNFIKSFDFESRYSKNKDDFDIMQLKKECFNNNLNEIFRELGRGVKLRGKCDDCPSFWRTR